MIAALSVPEHCLSFYFVCDDHIQISCTAWLRKMENPALTFCYLWLTEKLWLLGGKAPQTPTLKHLLHYYQSLSHNSTSSWVLVGEKGYYFDRLSFNRWLKLFNCQIFSWLAFGIKNCSSKTRFISSIFRLLCPALWHYVREHIIYTVYSDCVLVFVFAFLSWKKKKKKKKKKSALDRTFSTESYRSCENLSTF